MHSERLSRTTDNDAQWGTSLHRGMRIRVTDILELLREGASFEEVLEDYPYLQRDDILAAIELPLVRQITRFCCWRDVSRRQSTPPLSLV